MVPEPMKPEWSHNIEYHRDILLAVPASCASALDVGCGEGLLTRKLAGQCRSVTGLDSNVQMIAAADKSEPRPSNVKFVAGDIMTYAFLPESFTFVSSVATLHHLPLEPALIRLRELLAPGGVLVIVGLYKRAGFTDTAFSAAALIASRAKRCFHRLHEMKAPMMEPQQTLEEIATAAGRLLPASHLRRRLYFRYSLVWQKPGR
jgi:2-polyprenyl-3-methyl-5-hydroxy-6-metoxy-1,4-benzoquinol methylase